MKKFLKDIVCFCLFIAGLSGFVLAVNTFLKHSKSFETSGTLLIVGDSHASLSLDPNQFSDAQNIAREGETTIETFYKLKNILKNRTDVDTIIMSIGEHSISKTKEDAFNNPAEAKQTYRSNIAVLEMDKVPIDYSKIQFYKQFVRSMMIYPNPALYKNIGGFTPKIRNRMAVDTCVKLFSSRGRQVSECLISYIDSIHTMCEQNQIHLVFVETPVHQYYQQKLSISLVNRLKTILDSYSSVSTILKDRDYYIEEKYFIDTHHLNGTYATEYTNHIIQVLNERSNNYSPWRQ